MKTVVYTDGACSGNPGPGGWAWAVPGGQYAAGFAAHTTNQRMEVTAVLEALKQLDGPVEVVSDSTYVINCFRDRWWEGWLARNWTNSQKKPVANRDLWEPLIEIVRSRSTEIEFRWVKGHSGDVMNDLVDELAVEAGRRQQEKSGSEPPLSVGKKTGSSDTSGLEAPSGHLLLVTGHKPPELGGYGANPTADKVRNELTEIIAAKAKMVEDLVVVSGLNLGAEQIGAEVAIALRVPLVTILPYPDQQAVWPTVAREHYQWLRAGAREELLLQTVKPENRQKAGAALSRQAAWFCRHVHEAVVVWDEKDQHMGRFVRSLCDALGETEVWIINPSG